MEGSTLTRRTSQLIEEFAEEYLYNKEWFAEDVCDELFTKYGDAIELYTGAKMYIIYYANGVLEISHPCCSGEFIRHMGELRRLA